MHALLHTITTTTIRSFVSNLAAHFQHSTASGSATRCARVHAQLRRRVVGTVRGGVRSSAQSEPARPSASVR